MLDFFSGIIMSFINYLFELTGNYGWALVLLAVVIKLVLYGPTKQQFESMKKLQEIQPSMQKIQERYKDDQEAASRELMKLYKENGVNPLGGCLPMVIQLPILWIIWHVIMNYQSIFESSYFLWLGSPLAYKYPEFLGKSLAGQDALLILIYGFSMYLTQKTASVSSDPKTAGQQNFMGLFMTVFFTFMMWQWKIPCALIIYWLVFNIFSIVQQILIMNAKPRPKSETLEKKTEVAAAN